MDGDGHADKATVNDQSALEGLVRNKHVEEADAVLTIRDVSELLRAEYAVITGGKALSGSPIITFPDKGNFQQLSDEEYRKLIIYLTSVPSLQDADLGFVLIIDRRTDKWNSVKAVLFKIADFFPGLITAAYVLRPGGFLQKAISEVSTKFFRDEFKFKVVVCSCVLDLHNYIDKDQLTDNLEGCISYNHEEWIEQRVAVEKFSANTQDISNALRLFTQNLQETEFPNDASSCEQLLQTQSADYKELKEDLLSASKHGEVLLDCIKHPKDAGDIKINTIPWDEQMCPDKLINVTAVERLLVQLEETEKTFDNFWYNHENKLTQCLQLRRFETEFKELQPRLEDALEKLSVMTDIGDSVETVIQLIEEIQQYQECCNADLDEAENLCLAGAELMKNEHYGADSIQPKCIELLRMRDRVRNVLEQRLRKLQSCRELHEKIEKANEWCAKGVELLASQQIERYQTLETAEESLKVLEEFLSVSSDFSSSGVIRELKAVYDDVISSETKALVNQVLKRLEDVTMMCEKRKISLKKMTSRLPRPVHAVTPEPAVPLQYAIHSPQLSSTGHGVLTKFSSLTSIPVNSISSELSKSPKSIRKSVPHIQKVGDEEVNCFNLCDPEILKAKEGHVLKELLETERAYVSELCSVLKGYKDSMISPEMQVHIPINLYGKADILFGNMEEIFRFHNDIFLRDLENCINTPELIGLCFVHRKDTFHHLYSLYCQNKPQSEELRRQVGDNNEFFKECQKRLGHRLPLGAYLLKPVQRITKYQLLLKDLLQCIEETKGRSELQEAVDTMLAVLKCLNDSMHQVAITGFPGNLSDVGRLLMQGAFCVWNEKKGIRDLRLKPAQRHIFLYEKILLLTKKAGKDTEKDTYHFKNALKMSQIGLTENIKGNKGDSRKFEVWLQGRQVVYTILAPTLEIKDVWVKEIKRVLLDQFEFLKGENIKQYSSKIQKGASLNGFTVPPLSPTAQHRSLRQTTSWDVSEGNSISSNCSEVGKIGIGALGYENCREKNPGSLLKSSNKPCEVVAQLSLGDAAKEAEEDSWSSEYSPSDEEGDTEDLEAFTEGNESSSSRFLVLADYNAMGSSEVSLRESDYVDLIKVGCAGWWYVKVCGASYEGWAPAAYLERVLKKGNRSSPSVSSQESSSGMRPATSRSSVASTSNKPEEVT